MSTSTYINSEHVSVFPSARRGAETNVPISLTNRVLNSRVTSENAFSNIVSKLLDTDGFVISYDSGTMTVEFNLKGYYFQTSISELIGEDGVFKDDSFIYTGITLESVGDQKELMGQDIEVEGEWIYQGIKFFNYLPTASECTYKLLLLEKDSTGGWAVPTASLTKLKESSLTINIDGGEI